MENSKTCNDSEPARNLCDSPLHSFGGTFLALPNLSHVKNPRGPNDPTNSNWA